MSNSRLYRARFGLQRVIIPLVLCLVLILSVAGVVLASDVTNAIFSGTIRATNNSTAAEYVSANISINTQTLIDSGLVNAAVNNTAVRIAAADTAFMPGDNNSPWIVWFNNIPENSSLDAILYTEATGGKTRIFTTNNGMTTSDNSSLELSDNGSIEIGGYINTDNGSEKYIVHKGGALSVFVSPTVSGNITVYAGTANSTTWDSPISVSGWTNSANISDDDTGTTASKSTTFGTWSTYITAQLPPTWTDVVRVWVSEQHPTINSWEIDLYYDGAWQNVWSDDIPTGAWQNAAVGSFNEVTQARVRFYNNNGSSTLTGYIHEFDINHAIGETIVTATGVASGDHSVNVTAENYGSSANLSLYIDDVLQDTTSLSSNITDNSNNWLSSLNGSMPYVEYQKISVNGTLQQHIEWEYNTTLTDLSGNSHNATPALRTTSSDPDVSAVLLDFEPIREATASDNLTQEWGEMITTAPAMPATTYTEEARPGFFFEPVVYAFWSVSGLPASLFWYNFAFIFIIGVSVLIHYFFAKNKLQALLFKVIATSVVMIFFALPGLNIYGFYVWLYYAFFAFGVLMMSKDYGW